MNFSLSNRNRNPLSIASTVSDSNSTEPVRLTCAIFDASVFQLYFASDSSKVTVSRISAAIMDLNLSSEDFSGFSFLILTHRLRRTNFENVHLLVQGPFQPFAYLQPSTSVKGIEITVSHSPIQVQLGLGSRTSSGFTNLCPCSSVHPYLSHKHSPCLVKFLRLNKFLRLWFS